MTLICSCLCTQIVLIDWWYMSQAMYTFIIQWKCCVHLFYLLRYLGSSNIYSLPYLSTRFYQVLIILVIKYMKLHCDVSQRDGSLKCFILLGMLLCLIGERLMKRLARTLHFICLVRKIIMILLGFSVQFSMNLLPYQRSFMSGFVVRKYPSKPLIIINLKITP